MATITIKPAEVEDIPILAKISAEGFLIDRQTQMKNLGPRPYDHYEAGIDDLLMRISRPERCQLVKAIDSQTGQIIGSCHWSYRCFSKDEVAVLAESTAEELKRQERVKHEAELQIAERARLSAEAREKENRLEMSWKDYTTDSSNEDDPIVRLEKFTGASMDHWTAILEPPNTKCMNLSGCSVHPNFQGKGVGSALLATMTQIADRAGVHAWVHSSEAGWRAYQKAGFEVVGILDVDLDAYAPQPPPDWYQSEEKSKWGHYVFRYMKRMPVR